MGEVSPSGSKDHGTSGAAFGACIGLVVAVILSTIGLVLSTFASEGAPQVTGACRGGILTGAVLLAVAAGIGWLGWHMLFRNSSRTFGAGFVRGLSMVVAIYLLIPWPCSYTWAAYTSVSACARR